MHKTLEALIQAAEDHYLRDAEMSIFPQEVESVKERLQLYRWLREQEIFIFQPIANEFTQQNTYSKKTLEKVLKHWIGVVRYGAMAMLLNNPEFFQRRLLEFLSPTMNVRQRQAAELAIYRALTSRLSALLKEEQLSLIMPFLEQAADGLQNPTYQPQNKEVCTT